MNIETIKKYKDDVNSKEYDVIIVGAGVSGLMLAKLFNESKLKVLLIENRDTIKVPWNHRYGTTMGVVEKFHFDEKCIIKRYDEFEFLYADKEKSKFSYRKPEFCIIDILPFAQGLELSFEVKTSTTIKDIRKDSGKVLITDHLDNIYKAKIIVDCSGESKIVSKYLGQIKKGKPVDFYSISLELTNCNIPEMRSLQFIADLRYTNSAFWFYPYSTRECQFGLTEWFTEYPDEKTEYEKVFRYMKNESPYKEWLKDSIIKEKVFKIGPAATINVSLAEDNFLACGNAAGAGTPAIGEGFRVAVEMAQSAYETIAIAFDKSDFSRKTLLVHEKNFHSNFGKYYDYSKIIRFFVMNFFTLREYGLLVRNMSKLSLGESKQMLTSEVNLSIFFKLIDIKLTLYIISNIIKFVCTGCKPVYKQTA
ncbi:MAG: NAD(P)/FAD-dependent oxidoreductase [Patescibacteria group bacterium]|nr:NAD(P)/FAD-dependent oxidoreductase [Patescibacteria group bacterium]